MKHISIIAVILITLATQVVGERAFWCQSVLATGIIKQGDAWVQGGFETVVFSVKFNDDYTTLEGISPEPMDCKANFLNMLPSQIQCSFSTGQSFLYNKQTKRFVFANLSVVGFVENRENRSDSDTLYAGTCTTKVSY